MQNNLIPNIIIAVAIITAGFFISNTLKNAREYDRSVQVKGLSEREVEANLAVWPIQIKIANNDLKVLKTDLDNQKNQILNFFNKLGFKNEELNIGNTQTIDTRANEYNNQYNPYRYISQADITIRTSDIKKIQLAVEKSQDLIAKGILINSKNTWQPIEYSFTKLNDIKPQMIEEATKNAYKAAEKFANDSGSKVGKIKSAQQGFFSITNLDQNTAHIKKVRVVTTVDYYLND